ncbi:MAG: HAMP domain-containing protein [Acidobacteria bacterium]|nr:HAMP domain-containing protein [Acidobacteriota bacterium]
MKSLFLRIFLWFWVAMLVLGGVLVVTSPFFTKSRPRIERWERGAEEWAEERVNRAAQRIAESGIDESRLRGHRGPGRRGSEIYVFDLSGRRLLGGEAPEPVVDLAQTVAASGSKESARRGGLHLAARPVTDPDGRSLVVVSTLHRPPRLIDLLEPGALWWRLGLLALVVGVFSLVLARYLSSPVGELRRATQSLSAGNLSARVGSPVDRRRDEIGGLARDFDAMAGRLENLVGSQRRLLRDVSHELRSPLARLTVALQLARDRDGARATEAFDRIERETGRLDNLIGQLLLLERLEARTPEAEAITFDLGELVNEVVDDASFEASSSRRTVELDSGSRCLMKGHPALVRSALDNVIRNAVRHTLEGASVEVAVDRRGETAGITIRDHGSGVPEKQLEAVFEPFARVGEARERSTGGAGLGLAIARRAIEVHGGTVSARNHPDGGLEVSIRLPLEREAVTR